MKKIALIYGGLGQNGYLLTKFLRSKKYKIYAVIRTHKKSRKFKNVTYLKLNFSNYKNVLNLIKKINPDEIYNFLGPSDKKSFKNNPQYYFKKDFILNLYTLEACRFLNIKTKIFYSSSSEVFGNFKRRVSEKSKRIIVNEYALTKNMSELLIEFYRINFKINACYGVLFNHDSTYRKNKFLYKTILNFFEKKKFNKPILIKNINDIKYRSNAEEFVKIFWKILQKRELNDYLISANKPISVKNLIKKISLKYNVNLIWKKDRKKIKIFNKNKLIIEGIDKDNQYNLRPNLEKLKKNLDINFKKINLF